MSTSHIMMIRPAHFQYNTETAASNAFQTKDISLSNDDAQARALAEFDHMVQLLQEIGIHVHIFEDTSSPIKPDAIFPNNWVTFHESGKIITYPMMAPIRRLERREDIIHDLMAEFEFDTIQRLEAYENKGRYLEGTGSLVLDYTNKIAYACISPRTDAFLLERFCEITGFRGVPFQGVDRHGQAIYHTNVMMAMGHDFVVVCMDSIANPSDQMVLKQFFDTTGKKIIKLSFDQMDAFAGNMLQLKNQEGTHYLIMSQTAYEHLTPAQILTLEQSTKILAVPIPTIEKLGGGSVRCMMAEIIATERPQYA